MKGIKRGALVTAFLGLVLWACVGLLVGCKDLFHPEGPAEYTVTFNADNGSSGDFKKVTVKHGDSVGGAMPANPSRMGYTFDGWWTSRNGGGSQFTASTTVTGNITVYAKWTATTAVQYTVTFNLDGGNINGNSASVAVVVNSGDSVGGAMPANPSKSGYTFGGWYTQRNGGGSQFTASTTVSADRTVYARWTTGTGISYTVTFDADGGSPATQTRAVNSGASIGGAMPANPSKSGYTFDGWYTQRNGGGSQFTASTIVTAGITVYAKWTATTAVQYTVTFNLDGGNIDGNSASVAVIVNIGASTGGAMPAQPDKSGYTFDGWYTQQNGGGSQFTASTTVTGNITVYAKWTAGSATQYTVTFNADGGSPATQTQTVNSGASLGGGMPSNPSKSGYDFGGWWTSQNGGGARFTADTTVNANITVYAKWVEALPGNLSLEASLTWLASNAAEGGNYTITVSADETLAPKSLSYSGKNVSITLIGNSTERMIRLSSSGSLFTVGSGVTLTLGNNITLQGRSDNSSSLVQVNSGTLVMESGSKITGNTSSYGGGVYVSSGTFTMSGGEISGNTASCGGGVYVSSGTFTMSGGEISGNTASSYGGGVYVSSGTFTMSGGEISGNTASASDYYAYGGGGVYVSSGTFTMSGGEISGNTASASDYYAYGGGVYVANNGTFTKESGGTIYGSNAEDALKNTASGGNAYGHAVYVDGGKRRNSTAGAGVTLDSSLDGNAGGWVDQYTVTFDADGGSPATQTMTVDSSTISNIQYSSVSGGEWTLQSDERLLSPAIAHNSVTKARVSFTSIENNTSISIQLDVSSEADFDYAFISNLDSSSATASSGYYRRISGTQSVNVSIPVSNAGNHFIEIGYQKDGAGSSGSDCAWFKVLSGGSGDSAAPSEPTRSGYTFNGWYTAQNGGGAQFVIATAATTVRADTTVYAKWLPDTSVQISLRPAWEELPISNTNLFVSESAQFSAGGGYQGYTWYWDGAAIAGETSSTYTLGANSSSSGTYELSVVVTTSTGERLSARCRVIITAQ